MLSWDLGTIKSDIRIFKPNKNVFSNPILTIELRETSLDYINHGSQNGHAHPSITSWLLPRLLPPPPPLHHLHIHRLPPLPVVSVAIDTSGDAVRKPWRFGRSTILGHPSGRENTGRLQMNAGTIYGFLFRHYFGFFCGTLNYVLFKSSNFIICVYFVDMLVSIFISWSTWKLRDSTVLFFLEKENLTRRKFVSFRKHCRDAPVYHFIFVNLAASILFNMHPTLQTVNINNV